MCGDMMNDENDTPEDDHYFLISSITAPVPDRNGTVYAPGVLAKALKEYRERQGGAVYVGPVEDTVVRGAGTLAGVLTQVAYEDTKEEVMCIMRMGLETGVSQRVLQQLQQKGEFRIFPDMIGDKVVSVSLVEDTDGDS